MNETLAATVADLRKRLSDAEAALRADKECSALRGMERLTKHPGFQAIVRQIMRDSRPYALDGERPGVSDFLSARRTLLQLSEALSCDPVAILDLWKAE